MKRRSTLTESRNDRWIFVCRITWTLRRSTSCWRLRTALEAPVHFELAWDLGADYADIQEAQSGRREQERYGPM